MCWQRYLLDSPRKQGLCFGGLQDRACSGKRKDHRRLVVLLFPRSLAEKRKLSSCTKSEGPAGTLLWRSSHSDTRLAKFLTRHTQTHRPHRAACTPGHTLSCTCTDRFAAVCRWRQEDTAESYLVLPLLTTPAPPLAPQEARRSTHTPAGSHTSPDL